MIKARLGQNRSQLYRQFIQCAIAPDLLLHLITLCADLTPCVVVEGIESEAELKIAIDAGAHAVQGYLIEFPTIFPSWLNGAVSAHDSCMPQSVDNI